MLISQRKENDISAKESFFYRCTVAKNVVLEGVGLHSGKEAIVEITPLNSGSGVFIELPNGITLNCKIGCVDYKTERGVILYKKGSFKIEETSVKTVEHLLSALYGLGIDDAIIKLSGFEIPILDGSAKPIFDAILEAGVSVSNKPKDFFVLDFPIYVSDDISDRHIVALPFNGFKVTYVIDYPNTIVGTQAFTFVLDCPCVYLKEIAPARTYGFAHEVEKLKEMGLAMGGSLSNALVVGEFDYLNPEGLRFVNEPVRHKILDLIGDISLIGVRLKAHIIAYRAGHDLHLKLAEKLAEVMTVDRHKSDS